MTLPRESTAAVRFKRIPLELIETEEQVRRLFDVEAIQQLARSLKAEGQLQPILAYERSDAASGQTRYVVIAGERRLLAARYAELDALDAAVFASKPSEADVTRTQIVENALREQLEPLEQAEGFRRLMELEGINASELAQRLNLHKATIGRYLALHDLPDDVREMLRVGDISPGVAREIGRVPDEAGRRELLAEAMERKLRPEAVAKLANRKLFPKPARGRPRKERSYKLPGFDATLTPKKFVLTVSGAKKPRTDREFLEALEAILARLRAEIAPAPARSPA